MAVATREPETDETVEAAPESPEPVDGPEITGDSEPEPVAAEATIFERMIAIVAEMPAIGKTQQNREQGFMFRGHDDVMNALNPLLAKHGVFVVPDVVERVTNERTTGSGKTMYEVNLHVAFTFYGAGGDWVRGSGWGEGTDMGDKATNKAMTGAMKYVIAQTFALATREISETDADHTSPEETTRGGGGTASAGPTATEKQQQMVLRVATEVDEMGITLNGRRPQDAIHVRTPIADMTRDQASRTIDLLIGIKKTTAEGTALEAETDPLDAILGPPEESTGDLPASPDEVAEASGEAPLGA
jgi:ERF superfamily